MDRKHKKFSMYTGDYIDDNVSAVSKKTGGLISDRKEVEKVYKASIKDPSIKI